MAALVWIILLVFFYLIFLYWWLLKTPSRRRLVLKVHLFLIAISIPLALFMRFFLKSSKPESFNQGVELLVNNQEILNKTGDIESYAYKKDSLPKETDNPAHFKITLIGTKAKLSLTCTIRKLDNGKWTLIQIKQDSLKAGK